MNPFKSLITLFFIFLGFTAWSAWKGKGWIFEVPLTEKLAATWGRGAVRTVIFCICVVVIVFFLNRIF